MYFNIMVMVNLEFWTNLTKKRIWVSVLVLT